MREYESMTLSELRQARNHPVAQGDLSHKARRRLQEIGLDDLEELWSFRVDARKRLWCIRERNIYALLWWDPLHQVCPSNKQHT